MAYWFQKSNPINSFLFPAPQPSYSAADPFPELKWIYTYDSEIPKIPIALVGRLQYPCKRILVYFHGNGGDIGSYVSTLRKIHTMLAMPIIAVEYPGYGALNNLTASEATTNHAAQLVWEHLIHDKGIDPGNIIIVGRSIGTGIATQLAHNISKQNQSPRMLVLISPFLSIKHLAHEISGWLSAIIPNYFPNISNIRNVKCPVLIFHGEEDTLIPWAHALILYNQVKSSRFLYLITNASHTQIDHNLIIKYIKRHLKS